MWTVVKQIYFGIASTATYWRGLVVFIEEWLALLSAMGDAGLEKQIVFQSLKSRLHLYIDHVTISLLKRPSLRPLNKRGVADNSERCQVSESSDHFDITAAVFSFLPTDATNAFSYPCLIHFLMASDFPISFGVLLLSSCSGSNEKK